MRARIMSAGPSRADAPIRVLILEDIPVVREGLIQWLARHADIEVCGQFTATDEALAALGRGRVDVLLMDVMLGGVDGVNFIRAVTAEHAGLRVLVFSQLDESIFAERALRAGAMGYVAKSALDSELLAALRTVASGNIYVSARLSLVLLGRLLRPSEKGAQPTGITSLSDRELHVFQLLGAGLGAREIATRLGLSNKTIQAHRENIKNKLGLETAAELLRHAAAWAAERGVARQSRSGS
jgi:DNA-binding NarL/FixJ family response regulator